MVDAFRSDGAGRKVARITTGLSLFAMGGFETTHTLPVPAAYEGASFGWGSFTDAARALSLAILANCLGETNELPEEKLTQAWSLHEDYASDVLANIPATSGLDLSWEAVQEWIDVRLHGGPGPLLELTTKVHQFEQLLRTALDLDAGDSRTRYVDTSIWAIWDIEALTHFLIAKRVFPMEHMPRFIDGLLDIKFKLYCLLEVDLPLYSGAIRDWGLDETAPGLTPQGLAARLSSEATVIVKVRSVWESVMNSVHMAETGHPIRTKRAIDGEGQAFRSKAVAFWVWAQTQPHWSALVSFRPLVEALETFRTPELHGLSRLRGDFTAARMRPLQPIVELLNATMHYLWDHLVAVVAFQTGPTYDARAGTGMHIDLTQTDRAK